MGSRARDQDFRKWFSFLLGPKIVNMADKDVMEDTVFVRKSEHGEIVNFLSIYPNAFETPPI